MSASEPWLTPFVPRRALENGHVQTIVGNYVRRLNTLPPPEDLLVEVEPAGAGAAAQYGPTRILCHCHFQPPELRRERLTVVLVHGLEGSSSSGYILSNGSRLWAAGMNVVRMNMRSCGGTDALSPTIYHSGRSGDVGAVVERLREEFGLRNIALLGYSMGGNLVLKYAGEHAEGGPPLVAVVGVSPLMDLAVSSAALHEAQNRVYEWKFLRGMIGRLRTKMRLFPGIYGELDREGVLRRIRSLRDFDGEIVARYGGFRSADDYYARVASSRFAALFRVPTLLLHSLDDPFVRILEGTRTALRANRNVILTETARGGHCAFLAKPAPGRGDIFWAEQALLAFLRAQAETLR